MELNKYHLTDCIEGMKQIPSESVDTVIIDPPYNIGKDFGNTKYDMEIDEYVDWSMKWINESIRILKPTGSIFIYGFSEILAHLSVNIPLEKRWLIWHYTNKTVPTYKSGWQRSHESIIWTWKDKPLFNVDSVRTPYTETFLKNSAGKKRTQSDTARYGKAENTTYEVHEKGALPRDVFTDIPALAGGAGLKERYFLLDNYFYFPNEIKNLTKEEKGRIIKHPTQKPFKLTERLLLSSTPKDGTVIIPFGGSGSEGVVCRKLGYNFIGFDTNETYIHLSNKAVENYINI